jgi:uncharacterized spore protein YtfJ
MTSTASSPSPTTTTTERAVQAAIRAAQGAPADQMLERLAGAIGAQASVRAVFGEPIRQGERTVIPVAKVRWGFGGGSGSAAAESAGASNGAGGGGGAASEPVGFLEITGDGAVFRPIVSPYPSVGLILASGVAALLILRGLGRLFRRSS